MQNTDDKAPQKSSLFSKAIFIWFFALLGEFVIFEILMRNRQYLSPLPIIKNNDTRWTIFIASIVVYAITTIAVTVWYIRQRIKLNKR